MLVTGLSAQSLWQLAHRGGSDQQIDDPEEAERALLSLLGAQKGVSELESAGR